MKMRAPLRRFFFLADLTARQHSDLWLTDLLRGSWASNFSQAANALAHSVQANDAGDYDVSRQQAELAEQLFHASENTAGVLRAQFEHVYSDQLSRRSAECLHRSIAVGAQAKPYSYPWVQVQLGLEESVCSALMGDLGAYEKIAQRAQDGAQQAGYGALYLRALGFVAGSKFDGGDRACWRKSILRGLERLWSGQFPCDARLHPVHECGLCGRGRGQSNSELA